jgi:hypothetical protein
MPIGNVFKSALRPIRDRFLYVRGPSRCALAGDIAKDVGGEQILIHQGSESNVDIPATDQAELVSFLSKHRSTISPSITITTIPGGCVHAGGVVLSPDGTTVARDLSVDFTKPFHAHYLCGHKLRRAVNLRGRTLCVASHGATGSYYHWLLDELPRHLLPETPDFDQVICSSHNALNREAFRLLDLHQNRVIALDEGPQHYRCELLIAPSYIGSTGEPNAHLVELLNSLVEPLIEPSVGYPEKILISRKSARGRRIAHEDKLFAWLEPQGYELIKLEDLSWQQQINVFRHAREIFAPHGAGLANLIFCSNEPIVTELFHASYAHWCFWKLATLVRAAYVPITLPLGTIVDHEFKSSSEDIMIDDMGEFLSHYRKCLSRLNGNGQP